MEGRGLLDDEDGPREDVGGTAQPPVISTMKWAGNTGCIRGTEPSFYSLITPKWAGAVSVHGGGSYMGPSLGVSQTDCWRTEQETRGQREGCAVRLSDLVARRL